MSVQYRVAFGKKDEAVEGPDDADVVVTIAAADAGLDPSVAFMQGKLKADRPHRRAVRGAAQRRGGGGDQPARIASLSAR